MEGKAAGEFNMAGEIRELLTQDSKLSGRDVEASLRKKFPGQKINPHSCGVAFSIARRKLGLRRPTTVRSYSDDPDVDVLFAAKGFVGTCNGDLQRAFEGLKQLVDLQMRN